MKNTKQESTQTWKDVADLIRNTAKEGRTGRIFIPRQTLRIFAQHIGLEWDGLTPLGKLLIKADAIEVSEMRQDSYYIDVENFTNEKIYYQ